MALIKCKECGKEISDKAEKCVNCGCPLKNNIKPIVEEPEIKLNQVKEQNGLAIFIGLIIMLGIFWGGYKIIDSIFAPLGNSSISIKGDELYINDTSAKESFLEWLGFTKVTEY